MGTQTKMAHELRARLESLADPAHARGMADYFKESIHPLGVRSPELNRVTAEAWKQAKGLDRPAFWALCEALWDEGCMETGSLACKLAARLGPGLTPEDFPMLESWFARRVGNWAHCDDLATHALGELVFRHPQLSPAMLHWTASTNRWKRRAASVHRIFGLKRSAFLEESLLTAERLLADPDDLVQKGLGWMLKVAAQHHFPVETTAWLRKHKAQMNRTALRIACEKLDPNVRTCIMARSTR